MEWVRKSSPPGASDRHFEVVPGVCPSDFRGHPAMNGRPRRTPWILIALLCLLIIVQIFLRMYLPSWQNYSDAEAETAVHKVLDDQVAAWNRGDLDAFMQGYWKSPELKFFSGKDVTAGWEATLERYRKRYQSEGHEMGQLNFTDLEVKPLAGNTAWARGHWRVVTKKETFEGLFTLLLRRMPQGWRIVHDHTSTSQPLGPPAKPP